MASNDGDDNLALFCDFENVALGARDAKMPAFDMRLVLERLLVKGSIVVKKAYCDWERYKDVKAAMHEAAFELIEIPHTRQSGKNSADIRMVVDALDLCYTKAHIDTFVIISGDSDFSPLVGKLRENAKTVIGVGVKNSTSDLLMHSCDEFLFYDDLVRATQARSQPAKRPRKKKTSGDAEATKAPAKKATEKESEQEPDKSDEGIALVLETTEALAAERGEGVRGSLIKQTLKRRRPGFNESYYGFKTFGALLEEAQKRGLVTLDSDPRGGGYLVTTAGR